MPADKFKGPVTTPKDSERQDGTLAPTGSTLPAGAAAKGDKDPNRSG